MDTIYAVSTAPGRAGIAVVRLSGPQAFGVVDALTGSVPSPRYASLLDVRASNGDLIDKALVICFERGHSFTGEDIAEFHCHGSPAVVQKLLAQLSEFKGLSAAEPGEFTRRALENGQLDLAQVEGLADLLEAETESQRKQALRVFEGTLTERVESWRSSLIRALALLEATIDFADEDVPEDVRPEVSELIEHVLPEIEKDISGFGMAERVRSGFEVAIVGAPNVGKSTLLNRLAGRDAAITSAVAGTTRDIIEARMDLKGVPVTLLDTAGLRDPTDEVEKIGIDRARERAEHADLRIFLVLPGNAPEFPVEPHDIVVTAKSDVYPDAPNGVSGLTGQGVSALIEKVATYFERKVPQAGLAIRQRHLEAMQRAKQSLISVAEQAAATDADAELLAEELRQAIRSLDSIVGRFDIEAVLDEIFQSFCLGK